MSSPSQTEKPKILQVKTVAQSRLFHVEQLDLVFSNGENRQYERLSSSSHGSVLIVPMLDDDTVLLVREYAAGVERYELALPKGRIESGETADEAANRELMEEVGYGAKTIWKLKSVTLAPSYFAHVTHMMVAEDLFEQRMEGDEPEPLEVVPWKLSELDSLLMENECTEARSIAALFMVRDVINNR